jgi:sugar transferase (PEP-CTERM/EpsH1 system associated)
MQLVLTLDVGGLEMMVLDLVRHADHARFEHEVVCLRGPGELAPRFAEHGITVTALHSPGRLACFLRLTACLRRARPHVVHTHNANPHWYAALACRVAGTPVLVHTRHGRHLGRERRHVWANTVAARASSAVVPVSLDAADEVLGPERVPAHKVVVIHNGIEIERFRAERETRPLVRAISVARLNPVKDQPTLLRAVPLIAEAHPGFSLDIVGDGPERQGLERLRSELGLERSVRLLGHREDVAPLLAAADVFLLTSTSEGLALTLLEAMASGLPVVATDVGGNREVVVHGETGFLVPSGSPSAVAEATGRLLKNPELARAMGRSGRRRVEQSFGIRAMVGRYERLYGELLSQPPAGRR